MKKTWIALIALIVLGLFLTSFIVVVYATPEFVGSKKSDVYHYPWCHYVDRINPENLISFDTPEDAIAAGYRPCRVCKPPTSSTPISTPTPTITVSTDKSSYYVGEPIQIFVKATNPTSEDITLVFSSGHQTDYTIDGYLWSYDKFFIQAFTEVTVPAHDSHTWDFTHTKDDHYLGVGVYNIQGEVFGYGKDYTSVKVLTPTPMFVPTTLSTLASGKGIWIWKLWEVENGDVSTIIQKLQSANVNWVTIKCGDSDSFWTETELTSEKVNQFHNAGIKVFGWHYVYSYDRWGVLGISEADVSNQILDIAGIDGLIINAEGEYEGTGKGVIAEQYMEDIRAEHPDSFIAYSTFARIDSHLWFPYIEFGRYCDGVMPQAYWKERPTTPKNEIAIMKQQWDKWHATWESGMYGDSIKPIIPTGQGYGGVSGNEITEFCNAVYDYGYGDNVNLWRYGTMSEGNWEAYAKCFATPTPTPSPIPTPTPTSTPSPSPSPTSSSTPSNTGFEILFAIAGILVVAYLIRRKV